MWRYDCKSLLPRSLEGVNILSSLRLIHRLGLCGCVYDYHVCALEWNWRRVGRPCHRPVRDLRRSVPPTGEVSQFGLTLPLRDAHQTTQGPRTARARFQ